MIKRISKIYLLIAIVIFTCNFAVLAQAPGPVITRDAAVALALKQASAFEQAKLSEEIANEDVFQAKKAIYPKVTANSGIIYTSPSIGRVANGIPRPPSFLGANALSEYQLTVGATGEIDVSGRLAAARRRALALLEAARAGTEISRRELIRATDEAYFGLAFAVAQKEAAELNLRAAQDFENTTKLLVEGGEIPPVDLVKAQIQKISRHDELEQAKIVERISLNSLKVYLNFDESRAFSVESLQIEVPMPSELAQFSVEAVRNRPELNQLDAQKTVAEEDIELARSERRPQVFYSVEAGTITDSLRPVRIKDSAGIRATFGVSVPIFDWGASKSRQKQAELRKRIAESSRLFAERQFVAEFHSYLAEAKAAADRIRELAENLKDAEKVLDVAIERYKAGETTIIEVTDTQNLIVNQRLTLLQAIFGYQIVKARLKQATGK